MTCPSHYPLPCYVLPSMPSSFSQVEAQPMLGIHSPPGLFCILGSKCCFEIVHFTKEKAEGDSEVCRLFKSMWEQVAQLRQTAVDPLAYFQTL